MRFKKGGGNKNGEVEGMMVEKVVRGVGGYETGGGGRLIMASSPTKFM